MVAFRAQRVVQKTYAGIRVVHPSALSAPHEDDEHRFEVLTYSDPAAVAGGAVLDTAVIA